MTAYNFSSQDIRDNLTFMFQEPQWQSKIAIGSLINLVPILNFAAVGYMIGVVRNIHRGIRPLMPNWGDNFGKFFVDGLLLGIIGLIYALPILILSLIATPIFMNSSEGVIIICGGLLGLFVLLYSLGMILWMQGVTVNFATVGTFASGFAFSQITKLIREHWQRMLLVVGIDFVAVIALAIVNTVLNFIPCIGQIASLVISVVAGFYLYLVFAYNVGLISRAAFPMQPPYPPAPQYPGPVPTPPGQPGSY